MKLIAAFEEPKAIMYSIQETWQVFNTADIREVQSSNVGPKIGYHDQLVHQPTKALNQILFHNIEFHAYQFYVFYNFNISVIPVRTIVTNVLGMHSLDQKDSLQNYTPVPKHVGD
jgi:hypothetical protein